MQGGTVDRVAFQENENGRRIYLDLRDPRARDLAVARGNLNPGSLRLFQVAFGQRRWDYVVDVGANYGEMLAGLEGLEGRRRAIAFEPNRRLVPYLRRTFHDVEGTVQVRGGGSRTPQFGWFVSREQILVRHIPHDFECPRFCKLRFAPALDWICLTAGETANVGQSARADVWEVHPCQDRC